MEPAVEPEFSRLKALESIELYPVLPCALGRGVDDEALAALVQPAGLWWFERGGGGRRSDFLRKSDTKTVTPPLPFLPNYAPYYNL